VWRNVVPTFVYRALQGEALPLDRGGVATRDFIYVDDIVEGLIRCAVLGEPNGVYNLASGVETSIRSLAETINELAGNEAGVKVNPARNWDRSGRRFGSTEKASEELGFHAATALRDGLRRTVAWTHDHLDRIQACIERHRSHLDES
jgi:nucleoside-diphosphate-sugar epimerase